MKLQIPGVAERAKKLKAKITKACRKWVKWMCRNDNDYAFKRKVFNAQRAQRHPATLSPTRRRKLRST